MSNTIGKLSVVLSVNTGPFAKGMKRAQSLTQRMGKSLSTLKTGLMGVGAAAGLSVGGAALGVQQLVKQQLAAVDLLAKNAQRLKLSTQELAGLRVAAQLAGVKQRTLATAIQRMNRRLGDAQRGSMQLRRDFSALGLDVDALARRRPAETFMQIADAIKAIPDATTRASIAFRIFDEQARELFTLFDAGSEGIRYGQAVAGATGLAVTQGQANRVQSANDSMTKMQGAAEGLARSLTVAVAPAIDKAADAVFTFSTALRDPQALSALGGILLNRFDPIRAGLMSGGRSQQQYAKFATRVAQSVAAGVASGFNPTAAGGVSDYANVIVPDARFDKMGPLLPGQGRMLAPPIVPAPSAPSNPADVPGYVAPEQTRELARAIDRNTDALEVIVGQLRAGSLTTAARTIDRLAQRVGPTVIHQSA